MSKLTANQSELQTATILKFQRPEKPMNVLTQPSQAELAELEEIKRIGELQRPIFKFIMSREVEEEDLQNLVGFIEHLKTQKDTNHHPHISLVVSKRSGIN